MESAIFEGLERVFRAGASAARSWPHNDNGQVIAVTCDAMADAARREVEIVEARHD